MNEGVELAHAQGILTAASLMVTGVATDDAVARARRLPTLRVGLHLVLVDGTPVLPPERIPDLIDGNGRLRCDLARAGMEIFLRPRARAQVAAEIEAQFAAYRATGLPLDHVNAHHHFHLHPTVCSQMLRIGRRYGLSAVRVPREPAQLASRVRRSGLTAPDRVFGLAWSGAMTEERIAGVLQNLPDGLTEIYCHPATSDRFVGAAPGYRYADELAALTAPAVKEACRAAAVRSGGFADFGRK